jgi:hypothetical protein
VTRLPRAFHLPTLQLLSANLLSVAIADAKLFGHTLQPQPSPFVGPQNLAPQIVGVRSCRVAGCRREIVDPSFFFASQIGYIVGGTALNLHFWNTDGGERGR